MYLYSKLEQQPPEKPSVQSSEFICSCYYHVLQPHTHTYKRIIKGRETSINPELSLIDVAGLVGGHDVLDVDKGILATVSLEALQRLVNHIAHIHLVPLRVVDAVATVHWKSGIGISLEIGLDGKWLYLQFFTL